MDEKTPRGYDDTVTSIPTFRLVIRLKHMNFAIRYFRYAVGLDSSVGIATRYGLDGSGIEFR